MPPSINYIIPDNTVILSFKLTVGRVAITDYEMTTNEAIAHFKTNNTLIIGYLYLFLKNVKFELLGSTSSIAIAINSKMVKAMPLLVPDNIALESFNKLTDSLFCMIRNNLKQSRALASIRDALLPKLMSGEIEVGEENNKNAIAANKNAITADKDTTAADKNITAADKEQYYFFM
jgi:type I restriction enzyme S subunit